MADFEYLCDEYQTLKVEHIYNVNKYIIINTNKKSYLSDENNLYCLGDYQNVDNVIVFNNEIYVVVKEYVSTKLVKLSTLEEIIEAKNALGMIFKNNRYIEIHTYSKPTEVYDLQNNKYIKPPIDLAFCYVLEDGLFMFENEEFQNGKHAYYIVNENGDIIYECGSSFPYYVKGNLILINRNEEEIDIVHNLLGNRDKTTVIKKQGVVLGKPQYYNGDIVIVIEDGILIMDVDTNIKKKIPYKVEYPVLDTIIERNSFLMKFKINDTYRTIAVGLEDEYTIEHDSIELLPYWLDCKRTIFCSNSINGNLKEYFLYDENGKLLYKKKSKDAFIIESENYNLFIFYGIDGTNKNCIYNVDSGEEKIIPWHNVEFGITSDSKYQNYALCYNVETDSYDIVDDNLNVCFSGIDFNMLKLSISNISYHVNNNYVTFIEAVYDGPKTYFRKIVLDKNNQVIYDGFDATITNIGKYIEIKNKETLKYLNTETGEIGTSVDNFNVPLLPDNLCIEDNEVRLKKSYD